MARRHVRHVQRDDAVQAVGAGQIKHPPGFSRRRDELAFLALDGDARMVGHLLAAAGQQMDQRGLAAVRVAHQRHQGPAPVAVDDGFAHTSDSTSMQAASARRSAKVDRPTRTTCELLPNAPRAISATCSPGMKPISLAQVSTLPPEGWEHNSV
jgi:hypothetical protein